MLTNGLICSYSMDAFLTFGTVPGKYAASNQIHMICVAYH